MGPDDVSIDVVRIGVNQLGETFCTWDVLEHLYVREKIAGEGAPAAVGKFLREHASDLGILYQKDGVGRKGSALFKKIGAGAKRP
jgi:hypothetical protein